jgi:site-specific DNA-cytosine methylase
MAERPLYTLYKNLKAQNYDVPDDYNKFESALTRDGKGGADNRHAIYENLKAQNFDVPSTYERFYSALFVPRSRTSSRAKGGSVPMSAADRARFSAGAAAISASAQQTMNNAGRYNRLKQRKQKQQKDFGRVNLGTHQTPYGGDANNVVKDDFAYNPETGKAGAYVTSDNENVYSLPEAEQSQAQDVAYQNAVDTGEIPSAFDVRDKNGNYDLQENIGKNGTYLTEEGAQKQFDKKLADAYARKKEIEALIAEDNRQHGNPLLSYGASIGASNGRTAEQSDYRNKLATSLSLVTEQIGALEAVKQYPTSSWGEDALKALDNTAFTAKTWDFGLTDFAIMGQMERIKTKMDNKIPLSGSDKMLLKSKLGADAASALEDEKMGNVYRWTKIAGQSLPFMADFFLTGGYGGITKGISRGALKFAAKRGMGKVSAAILKNTGIVAGDVIGSYAMAGTEQALKTGADIMQRHLGNLYQDEKGDYKFGTFDENGNLLYEGGESMGTALYKGMTSAMVENYTEKLFGHNYGIKKGAVNFMEKHGMNASAEFFKNIGKSGWYSNSKKWMEKFGINGFAEEVMEEEIGIPLHALLDGEGKVSDLLDARQQLDIIGGMAISVGSMYAMGAGSRPVKGIYNRAQYYRFRNKVNVADNDAQNLMGDSWVDIKDKIDNATNEQMGSVLAGILRQRDTMSKEQINAAVNYGVNLMKMRGYNIAKTAEMNAREITNEPTTPEEQHQTDIDNAYSEGHDADDADKHDIQIQQEDQMKTLAAALGISEQQLSAMSDEELESLTGKDDKLDQAIYDYQLSSARYQGVVDDAQDKVDLAAHQAEQRVDMYTDQSRGSVRNATIKASGGLEDYGVYIISGNIATHDDGSIDVSNSDDMILYYDPTTNSVEHADALMFAELGEELPADDVKAQAVSDAKENAIKEIAGIIDGTVEVGSQFNVTDTDGTEHTYEVLADYGDGTAAISIDGNVVENPYQLADLQQMKDLEDQKKLEAAKAEREQMEKERAEQQTQQTEETQPSFDFNQILNDDGNVVLVDVLDKDGNTKYPDSKLFLIRDTGAKAKVVELKSDGTIVPHAVNKEDVATISSMSLDEYKQAMPESSMIEDNSGEESDEDSQLANLGLPKGSEIWMSGDGFGRPKENTQSKIVGIDEQGSIILEDKDGKKWSASFDYINNHRELPPLDENTNIVNDENNQSESNAEENTPAPEQTPAMTLEDGTIVPMLEDGNPDFSKLTAAQTAELYDTQFGEDADSIVSGYVSDAKKALDKASNMTVKGKTFVEQKDAKDAKEKAIADAQAAYDSAIAIRDAYNERQLAKVKDTAEGRKELIEKARRKFARLKSAVKDDAEAVAQIYKETVGTLLHRLYDGTGIDVTDTIPLTAEEYVASNLGAHSLNYEGTETSKGVKQETGLSREDFAKTQLLAADGKGTTIDNLVHSLWENRPSNLDSLDTQDIRNALLSIITSGFKASEARNYIENLRIAQAENILEEQKKAADNAAFAEENKAESEQQTETAPESEEKTGEQNYDEENDEENEKINEQTNENINAPEVPEDATDENPLGAQRDQTDLPFSARDNGTQQTTSERAADVEKNKVDDMKVVDNILGEKTRKAFERLAKMMGANIQWQYSDKLGNGWIQETTDADGNVHRTIFITLDSSITEGAQFIFGHEMTHQIKNLNPAAYNELTQLVLDTYGSDAFDKAVDETMQRYSDAGFSGRARDYYAEEVVADAVGEMIRDLNLAHTLAMKMSHPLLAAIHEILQKIKLAFFGTEYSDVTKNIIRSIEQAYVKTAKGEVTNSETGEDVSYSLRQKPEPKKKGIGYKVFVLKDGKLYPPMVANPNGAATPVGVWLDADAAPIAGESKTGRPQVKQGGKGTQGGSGKLAYRPGWHLGVVPYAIQFNRKDAEGNKTLFPKNFVFAEVEYAADVDYQEEARQEGINPSGKYQHSLAGLKHLPTDGYYMYRTNPNPETDPWVITGAMKVNRILTRAEQADLVSKAGREPQQIQEGDIVTDDVVNSINQEIADAPKFSLKVYHGSGADFTEFDFDHMSEGAGSQAFGWGGYVTSSKKIGKSYATLMDNDPSKAYYRIQRSNGTRFAKKYPTLVSFLHGDKQIAMNDKFTEQEKIDYYNEMKKLAEPYHNLYEVDIPEDNGSNYLDWDAPITDELIDNVAKALPSLRSYDIKDLKKDRTFDNFYKTISMRSAKDDATFNDDKAASQLLASLGYTGIKYKAGRNFGGAEEGDTNYVIFKPEDMKITEHTKFSIKTYHGSQASFDHFDHSFMGSGEGAQAYGWGTYVSEVEGIAKAYAKANTAKRNTEYTVAKRAYEDAETEYKNLTNYIADSELNINMYNIPSLENNKKKLAMYKEKGIQHWVEVYEQRVERGEKSIKDERERIEEYKVKQKEAYRLMEEAKKKLDSLEKPKRNLYSVEIPDDTGKNYLDWDGRLPKTYINRVNKALEASGHKTIETLYPSRVDGKLVGQDLYDRLRSELGSQKAASLLLKDAGFVGVKVIAQRNTGGNKKGMMNYVIFDENNAQITSHAKFSLKDIKSVGKNQFGDVYDQFKGKPKEAFDFLLKNKDGYLKGVFHRDEIGDIDLAYGSAPNPYKGKGLAHIIRKHVETLHDFPSVDDAINTITDVISNGVVKDGSIPNTYDIENGDYRVVVAADKNGNWVLTAFDYVNPTKKKKKGTATALPPSQSSDGAGAVAPNLSAANIINSFETTKKNGEKVDVDGTKFSLKDEEYLKAVEDGNMEKAQKMVNEAADAAGYSTDSSYQGTSAFNGAAPWGNGYFLTKDERKEAWDNGEFEGESTLGDYINDDIDGGNLEELTNAASYRAADPMRKEAIDNVRNAIQKKAKTITMYRSVPSDVKEGSFRNGDWVTPSRAYAVDNAKLHGWGDDYNIIEQKVPVDDVWFDGNDIAEWGYGREEDYINDTDFAYKNSKNNKKLLDAVTYDDNGNVIPLSQRFNEKNKDVRFSLKDEKTMFGMHNISVDKLRKAIKQGGFAAPSMGVVDSKNGIYSDYGEITLIPKAEKLAKRTGKNAGTFTADAWTPTYPQVERIMNKQGEKAFNTDMNEKLGDVDNGIYSNIRESWKGYLSSGDVRDGLYWHYLFDKGMNPETIYQTGKYDNDITNEVMRISDNGNKTDYTDKEVAELIQLMNKATGKDNDVDAQREKLKARIASAEKQGNHLLVALKKKRLEELEGVENFYIAADFVNDVVRNNRKNGKVDVHDTMGAAKKKVEDNKKLSDDFPSWLDKKTEEYGVEEMLYNGTTPSGKPKYIPNTIENAVKLMKKQGVAGGYTAFGSELGVFIAKNSPEVNTLAAMKNAKDKLIPFGDERHNQIKDKITKEFLELSDEIRVGSNNRYAFDDSGVSRMVELTNHKGNEKEYLKKAYNIEVSDEWMDRYNKLLDTIKKDYKVFYFETKFMRPYGLDEFEKAIVPSDTPSDVVDALKKAGIDVSSYERGNAEDRQKVTMDAINSSDNIRFSLAGERGAAAADKAEERTFRMDNLSVARKMEEEKKDAKAIKMATGWERGADGKWRYEMPDAKIKDTMDVGGGHIVKRYEDDMLWNGGKLSRVIDAPELFKAYPQLKDVRIDTDAIMNDMPSNGEYNSKTNTITIHADDLKYMNGILNHEIQHTIQDIEGFAKGGSPRLVRGEVKKKLNEVTKQIRQLRAEGKEDEAKALIEKNRGLYNAYQKNDDYNSYKSLAGEVEARNVSARLNMTPEERRKSLAESTEDVARKDQIFLGVGDVTFSLRDMADGMESGAADMAEDLKSLNTPDEVDDAIKTAIDDMPSGWKMANKKMIHIAQALGENRKAEIAGEEPKFSLKDGSLIKAGTYFSGGGLVEEGLKGIIDPVVAVEYDEKISGVYRNNFGQHIVTADVRDVDPKELVKQIDGEVEYFHASPVCKNYSQAKSNHAEVELDKETAASTAEFINAIKPKVVTIENVKGYKDSDAMKTITDALDANGYTWDADVYNAADYGGYTNRERLIVRAVRDGKLPAKPKKMAHKSGWYEAVADIIPTLTEKKNGVANWMDIRLKADGIDWRNINKPLYVMGSAYADGKVPHAFADELLPTLRTKSGDVIVMPDGKVYRAMGRVLARVSGVSDDYKMPFSENLSHTIIGNGIPTQLTEHVIAPLLTGSDPKFSIRAYHGTGVSFDKFDLSHAFEGEGSETFGHGVYVTNSKKIGDNYAQRAKDRKGKFGFDYKIDMSADAGQMLSHYINKYQNVDKGLENARQDLKSALEMFPDDETLKELSAILQKRNDEIAEVSNEAYRYDVDIPDDNGENYLGWNESQNFPLEKWYRLWEITHHGFNENEYFKDGGARYDKDRIERIIQMKLDSPENGMQKLPTLKGEELYHALEDFFDRERPLRGAKLASRALSEIGFVGIKYPAGMIHGGAEEADYNYVIFDENNANIVGNTRFSLRYDQFEHDLNQWKKDNNLPKDAQRPTIPQRNAGESAVDFLRRVDEYRKQMALWKTAPTYEQHLLSDDTALGEFNRELQRGSVLKRIAFQDSMLAIRKAQEAIMKEVGVDRLNMAEDAYTAENRSHGKGKNEFEEYNNDFLQPLRKAYHQMKKILGDSYDNVRIYMMAKHGLERDAQMAFKKSLEADYEDVAQRSAAYKAYKGDMNRIINDSDLEFGRINFTTWRQRDNALRVKYSPSFMNYRYDKMGIAYDYSGLSALFDGSDFEEAAYKLVRDIESSHVAEVQDLWNATNAATKKILRDGYKAGMMSKDTYQYVRDMYSHYIPLRGWDGTTADQVWDYIGGGNGAFNQTLKKAHGRTSIADDPISYIENMAESGILLNNKNWVKQHLMLLAQNHPTSLLTLSKAWYVKSVDDNGNEEWIPATPQITSQMDSNQVKAAIDAFEKKMEQMAQTGDATQKRDGLNIAYPQTHSEEREHEVRVMKDGEEYVIYVNGDPQLAQAMNNTRAHRVREIQSGKLDRAAAWLGRKMAAAYTSLSPLFIPSNYFRDLTMTLASTAIREDAKYNYLLRKNLATSWNLGFMLRDYQNGKLREKVSNGNATPKEQMFYDFMMNGGETGFVSSLDVEDLKKKFKNDLKDLDRWKANPVKVGHTIMDGIEFLNRAIEDSNRFAIYMTSIQYGRSIDEAVNDAKDVTLNFNRKGTGEYGWQMIRNLYLFINPAVQSLQTLGALAKHHPFKFTAVTASWLASGVLVPIVNAALMSLFGGDDDKDKYWQFTKWDRRNNLIMWVPFTHEYVKIPLAQEFRAFYGVGDMIASKMMGGELAEESWSQYAEDLLGQVVDMLPLDPTGYDGNIAVSLMPNPIRPIFELAFNVDFTGKPLFKETEYNKYDPNFTKAYVGTPDWLVRASKMVNSIGNDYPDVQQNSIDAFGDPRYNLNNPAVVDHVLSSYLGGAYTMGSQVLGVLTKSLNDPKEIKVADIPLFSKFVSNPDDRPVTKKQGDEFWNMKENHDRAANTLSKLKKQAKVDGDYSMLERFYGSEEYKQYKQDDVKVKKYEEDKKKERAEESGEEYRHHKLNAEDIYKAHATPKDDFEDLKLKQLFTKLNGFKTSYDLLLDTAPSQSDGYYNTNKAAIDAIDEISLDKQEISELKKGFLDDGKDAYNAEDMKQIRELRKKILAVLEKANKVVVANQKAKSEK